MVFFFSYEKRRPQARELVTLAVMSAIAVVSRAAFVMIPFFKPMMGIVMITGMEFGPGARFLTGVISSFVSNFIFGQGPWTPWQMFAYGVDGAYAVATFGSGVIPNAIHGLATALTLLLLAKPVMEKLERMKIKYGMMSNESEWQEKSI